MMRKRYLLLLALVWSHQALAVLNTNTNASAVGGNAQAASPGCDNVCDALVTDDGGSLKGLDGSAGWKSGADDQWCADHGAPTEASVVANTNKPRSAAQCNVIMFEGENCQDVNQRLMHCKFHNSQLEPQCMAYKAADSAGAGEHFVFALDTAAAVACITACTASWTGVGAWAETACAYGGVLAGVGEFAMTLAQDSSPVSKMLKSAAVMGGTAAHSAAHGLNAGIDGLKNPTDKMSETKIPGTDKKFQSSCVSAAGFTILAGLRMKAIGDDNKTKDDACKSVQQLASSAMGAGNSVAQGYNGAYFPTNGSTAGFGRTFAGGTAGGVTGASAGNKIDLGLNCISNSGLSSCLPNQSAAMDSKIFSDSGFDKRFASTEMDKLKSIINAAKSGMTAGQIMDKALGGGNSEASQAFAQLADEATKKSSEIAALMKPADAAALASAGGMSGSKGGSKGSAKPMGGFDLFGGFGSGAPSANAPKEMGFDKEKRSPASLLGNDIFHSEYKGSIFELVSTRIDESKDKVMTLEWSTPLNRALNGLSNNPNNKKK